MSDTARYLEQPTGLKVATNAFLAFWLLLASFPLLWIVFMSVKLPIDSFASDPFQVVFGYRTREAAGGLSLIDIVAWIAALIGAYQLVARLTGPLAARIAGSGIGAEGLDQSGHAGVGLQRRAVDDQPCGDVEDARGLDQPVLLQRLPAGNEIDDPARQPKLGRYLHRAVELDAFRLNAALFEMAAGEVGIFGRDAQMARSARPFGRALRFGDGEVAVADIEIDRRVELGIIEFLDHVRPDDADLRRAMGDEGGDVEGAHADQPHIVAARAEGQRAVGLVVERVVGHHARARHHRQGLVEDPPLGHGEGQRGGWRLFGHRARQIGSGGAKGKHYG